MEYSFNFIKHLPRRHHSQIPVDVVGLFPGKDVFVNRSFIYNGFSFVLEGCGRIEFGGKEHRIEAPYVLTQIPHEMNHYGPDTTWEEIFILYNERCGEPLRRRNLIHPQRRFWPMANPDRVCALLEQIRDEVLHPPPDPDRLDYLCEGAIVESLLGNTVRDMSESMHEIRAIKALIVEDPTRKPDFRALAQEHGMSLSTFRRRWGRCVGMAPGRFRNSLLMSAACRQLIEAPDSSIAQIADRLAFEDPYYFSKKFHKEIGLTPTQYRRLHRS